MLKRYLPCFIVVWSFFSGYTCALTIEPDKATRELIKSRIKPIGESCLSGESCAQNAASVPIIPSKNRSTEEVYATYCSNCHEKGLLQAPITNDTAAWKEKLKKAGGLEKLVENAIKGVNAMPAKGTCMDCSPQEIEDAILFMSGLKKGTAESDQSKPTQKTKKGSSH